MKIKFARTLAIASALSVAFAGLTAFAAAGVQTITTYDHTAADSASVTVTTTVTGLKDGAEVAYYVCEEGTAGAVTDKIVYIDQGTFDADAGKLEFKFTDTKGKFLTAMAKFGTDTAKAADETAVAFPTFYFNEGTNYLTEITAQVEKDTTVWNKTLSEVTVTEGENKIETTVDGVDSGAYIFKGKVSGAAKAYGVKIVTTGGVTGETADTYYFPAYGCGEDGSFVVIIEGYEPGEGDTIDVYVE